MLSYGQAAEQLGGQFTPPNVVRVWVVLARVTVNGSHVRVTAGQLGHPRLTGWGRAEEGGALDTKESRTEKR